MSTSTTLLVADVVVGGVLVAASLGRWRTPSGALLIASGAAWWLGALIPALTFLHRGLLIHLVLSHPGRRPPGVAARITVAVGYGYACIAPLAANDVASLMMAAVVLGVAVRRHAASTGPRRASAAFALAAAACLAGALAVGPLSRITGIGSADSVLAAYDVLVVGVAVLVAADVLRAGSARGAVAGLVVDLGQPMGSDILRSRLATRLGDPGLRIGYWMPSMGAYADDTGQPITLPPEGVALTVTPLQVEGQPIAVLIHEESLVQDPRLLDDVAAAAKWAVGNLALRAEVRQRVEATEASRLRILMAADTERVRLEQRLQQGPGRHLQRVTELIAQDGSGLSGLGADVAAVREQIGDLARGLHPPALAEGGLPAALRELAASSPLPIRLDIATGRLPAPMEITLYFACAEALTNVLKHARATQADVSVDCREREVTLVVVDNGVGGADRRYGTGLRGLADRVDTLGGRLEVESPGGAGTRMTVWLPMAPHHMLSAAMAGP